MKYIWIGAIASVMFTACTKKDTSFLIETTEGDNAVAAATGCNVRGYTSTTYNGVSYGNGLVKTYYPSGKIKMIKQMMTTNHDRADSVIYNFVYYTSATGNLMAKIYSTKKHFVNVGFGEPAPNMEEPDEHYVITAALDPVTQRLIKVYGTNDTRVFTMQYSGDRLLKFGTIEIGYDADGNITWIPKRGPGVSGAILYQYNHSKKAAKQFYITSGYGVHEYYNLAEVCDWIPVQPVNLRTRHSVFWSTYKAGELFFDKHILDQNGYLLSYRNVKADQIIYNAWTCRK